MNKSICFTLLSVVSLFLLCFSSLVSAAEAEPTQAEVVAKYNYIIHILAMLLIGFGFLMVFVRRYGFGAITGTYLVVAVSLPFYIALRANGVFGHALEPHTLDALLFALLAGATGLIAMGAVLGRLRVFQYALLALLVVPLYLLNELIVLDGLFGLVDDTFQDTAGSIVIHAFGAYFGLAMSVVLTTEYQRSRPIESDHTSDRFAMLGSVVLWLFWPSFATALVPLAEMPQTVVNTLLALSAATNGQIAPSAEPAPAFTAFDHRAEQKHESYAIFGQVDYRLSEKLTLTAGLRYTDENRLLWRRRRGR